MFTSQKMDENIQLILKMMLYIYFLMMYESIVNQTFNSYYLEMTLEIKQLTRLQIIKYCEKLEEENKSLNEKIIFLEQCLDNKEKVNKSLREEI